MKIYTNLILSILIVILAACRGNHSSPSISPTASPFTIPTIDLEWSYPEAEGLPFKNSYEIWESIYYSFGITNHTQKPLDLYFIQCHHLLAFDDPLQLHLLAPDGTDLFAPYLGEVQSEIPEQCTPFVQIEPAERWGKTMGFSRWLQPRQLGTYRLWAEYTGAAGQLYTSNVITFEIQAIPTTVSPQLVDLQIGFEHPEYTLDDHPLSSTVTFTNHADQSLVFLKPQDGSRTGFVNPIYRFTMQDQSARNLEVIAYDAGIGTPKYNAETMFTLPPKATYSQTVRLMYYPIMWEQPGEYQVQLTYIVRTKAIKWGMVLEDEPMHWDDDVFTGVLESNVVTLTITTEDE